VRQIAPVCVAGPPRRLGRTDDATGGHASTGRAGPGPELMSRRIAAASSGFRA
jgi:hypothetical protein